MTNPLFKCRPGDLLWVRETWWEVAASDGPQACEPGTAPGRAGAFYRADHPAYPPCPHYRARVSIHMPRWASRLTLEVTEIRRQRLQDISDADAEAEGVVYETADPPFFYVPGIHPHSMTAVELYEGATASYRKLWDYLHGTGAWNANPEVLALTFKVRRANVSALCPGPDTTTRPILFSAPMIRALLQGRKTQTRRSAEVKE